MNRDEPQTDALDLWQNQNSEAFLTRNEIRKRIELMEKKLRRETADGFLACAFLALAFIGWEMISTNPIQRIGAALTVIGVSFMAWQIQRKRVRKPPAENGEIDSSRFLRMELARQRDFHRGPTFWSRMLLFFPGPIVFSIGFGIAHPEAVRILQFETLTFVVLVIAAIPLNAWIARKYQRQIDDLDRLQGDPQ